MEGPGIISETSKNILKVNIKLFLIWSHQKKYMSNFEKWGAPIDHIFFLILLIVSPSIDQDANSQASPSQSFHDYSWQGDW